MAQKIFILSVYFFFSLYCFSHGQNSETTILCADGLGSVKTSALCDYVADCKDASDELNFNLCKVLSKNDCGAKNKVRCDQYTREGHYNSFFGNQCTDIIVACNIGPKCFQTSSKQLELCNEVQNGRLKATKFIEESSNPEKPEENEEFHDLMKFIGEAMNETMKRNISECPPFFTPFGKDECISLFTPIQVSWFEARLFCESMTGDLAILDDIQIYIQVLNYIQEKEIKAGFWVGGKNGVSTNENSTESKRNWSWVNGEDVAMGVPFWSLYTVGTTGESKQCQDNTRKLMPRFTREAETCLSILEENFYYFSDEFCTEKLSPLCMTNRI